MRDAGGRRVYDETILRWIDFLARLKSTGMGISKRQRYAELRTKGAASLKARRIMLEEHRQKVSDDIAALTGMLTVLDEKIELYKRTEAGDTADPAFENCARTEHGARAGLKGLTDDKRTGAGSRADPET